MNKLLSTLALIVTSTTLWAQGPRIEGTYLPVPGTSLVQVYDTVATMLDVPSSGPNQVWDYANKFVNATDTFIIRTYDPDSTAYAKYANGASFATFLRTPFAEGDSVLSFYKVDPNKGVSIVGGYYAQAQYDTVYYSLEDEVVLPFDISFGHDNTQTSKIEAKLLYQGYEVKAVKTKNKRLHASGYGTLSTPLGTLSQVLMGEETVVEIDSIYFKYLGNYVFSPFVFPVKTNSYRRYHFLRNNTFATSELMMLQGDTAGTDIKFGWFTLPKDFGHIAGAVRDTAGNNITAGMAHLYRDHSNFTKDDILATAVIDGNGHYEFDTIPYGQYRVEIKPDSATYPTGVATYYGDTSRWNGANPINSKDTSQCDVKMNFHEPLNGSGKISGNISLNWNLYNANKMKMLSGDPIPGIDIIVEKTPGGSLTVDGDSNLDGDFTFDGLGDGDYELFVDVPGLEMTGTYTFTISGNTVVNDLDFTLGADSVYPNSTLTGVSKIKVNDPKAGIFAYPNPYKGYTNIKVDMEQKGEMTLEVYDLVGKKITTIDKCVKEQGEYTYKFSAKDLGFASGMYVVKLTTPNKITSLKIAEQ